MCRYEQPALPACRRQEWMKADPTWVSLSPLNCLVRPCGNAQTCKWMSWSNKAWNMASSILPNACITVMSVLAKSASNGVPNLSTQPRLAFARLSLWRKHLQPWVSFPHGQYMDNDGPQQQVTSCLQPLMSHSTTTA